MNTQTTQRRRLETERESRRERERDTDREKERDRERKGEIQRAKQGERGLQGENTQNSDTVGSGWQVATMPHCT